MNDTAALVSLATAIPPYQFHQKQILQAAHDLLADRYPQFETLSSLFANTGIRHRYGVKPIEWYLERRGWPERTRAFLEGAELLFVDVARKAIARANLSASGIDTIVTVCSTGIATPTLEARVAGKLGLRTDVSRVPVFGLGCAGGVSGLSIAARLAQALFDCSDVVTTGEGNIDRHFVEQPSRRPGRGKNGARAIHHRAIERGVGGIADQRGDERHPT